MYYDEQRYKRLLKEGETSLGVRSHGPDTLFSLLTCCFFIHSVYIKVYCNGGGKTYNCMFSKLFPGSLCPGG